MNQRASGFTIVELLIVIVVIAILAALSYVGYTSFQQRAINSSMLSAVSQTIKAVRMYAAQEGTYPGAGYVCVTTEVECVEGSGIVRAANPTFNTNMAKIGTIPTSVPSREGVGNGIVYHYSDVRTFEGQSRPALIVYWLEGINQKCGLPDVYRSISGAEWTAGVTSTTGLTGNLNATNKTHCVVAV